MVTVLFVELENNIIQMTLRKSSMNQIIRLAAEFFADVKLCYEYDKTLVFCNKDFEYKWRLSSGETGGILLRDCDNFL